MQDKCDTVNYPSGYTDVQAFLDYYNASGKNIHLTIDYSIDGILNCFKTKHKNVSEKYIYEKIKNGKKIIEWIKLDTIDIGPASPKTISKRKTSKTSTTTRSAKLTNDQLKFQPFDDNLNGFKEYLIARGYNGISYYSTIKAIASSESLSFKQMLDKIDALVDEYAQSGIKADMGNRNNGGWRSALNRMQDFRNYLRDYLKTI